MRNHRLLGGDHKSVISLELPGALEILGPFSGQLPKLDLLGRPAPAKIRIKHFSQKASLVRREAFHELIERQTPYTCIIISKMASAVKAILLKEDKFTYD